MVKTFKDTAQPQKPAAPNMQGQPYSPTRQVSTPPFKQLKTYEKIQTSIREAILATQKKSQSLHHQERRLLIQSFAALGSSVVIGVIFLFVIFPLMVRFAGNLRGFSVFQSADKIPPRIPVYSAPVLATQEQQLTLEGFAEPKSTVVLVKNNQQSSRVDAKEDGSFLVDISLEEGQNQIALYSIDEAKNESELGKTYTVIHDQKSPEITWDTPEDQVTITHLREQEIDIKGALNEPAKLTVNDRFVPLNADQTFSTKYSLGQGENSITIKAVDEAGNESEQTRKVFFKP